jgi:hypothetical protein
MQRAQPVIIGGNGHSGTRVFAEIVRHSGLSCGLPFLTRRSDSADLRILDLLNRWVYPYLYGQLDQQGINSMKKAFSRRLGIYFPVRRRAWSFKNPRCMLILPVLHDLFPGMKFVHVIRDGRDIALGNELVSSNRYLDAFLTAAERALPAEQKMILFWGRSNARAREYGRRFLGEAYRLFRWEDMCRDPARYAADLVLFAGGAARQIESAAALVSAPGSMGRWKDYSSDVRDPVVEQGQPWRTHFGYPRTDIEPDESIRR